jgi:D-3-phosphoglycerate dehydrogenase
MKTVFPDRIIIDSKHLSKISELVQLENFNDVPDEQAIIERISNAEIITANWIDITPKIIDSARSLKAIIVPAVGFEWVDTAYARSKGIDVINCPTHNTHAVAELTLGLMYAVSRKIVQANIELLKGEWRPNDISGVELMGKQVLLIGHGNIGSKTHLLLESVGMNVVVANSKTTDEVLDKEIAKADYVVLNVPLNPRTKHLMSLDRLSKMKNSAFLINTARGAVVDQQALIQALQSNTIAGAALDVFEGEPLTGTLSEEMLTVVNLPNVVATPHIGFNTKESSFRLGLELIENIKAIVSGKPINVVN